MKKICAGVSGSLGVPHVTGGLDQVAGSKGRHRRLLMGESQFLGGVVEDQEMGPDVGQLPGDGFDQLPALDHHVVLEAQEPDVPDPQDLHAPACFLLLFSNGVLQLGNLDRDGRS